MKTLHWSFAHKNPVLSFLLITFTWTWLFWFAAIPFQDETLFVQAIVTIGGFGPAIGGILTLGLKRGLPIDLTGKKLLTIFIAALVIFSVMALRYIVGNIPNYDTLADDLSLSTPIIIAVLMACLVGGWVISNAFSKNTDIKNKMGSILPKDLPIFWTILALVFYPTMILLSWGLATILGMNVEYPGLWNRPFIEVLPIYALTFALTFFAQGGNEEPGWRGFMQPEMQNHFSPLVAAIIVSVFWSLWHLPLFLNGFYSGDVVTGMLIGAVYRVFLAIFLAWFYNRSGGSIFLMVILHTSFNMFVGYLPVSDIGLLLLWILVGIAIVIKDKMWQKIPIKEIKGV